MSVERGRGKSFVATLGRGMQPASVRQANQRAILVVIGNEPGLSNAELSRRSGLAPQTVSAVLADLEERQLIRRGEVLRGKRGQPATPVYLNERGAFAIGAEIGWAHMEVTLVDFLGTVLDRVRHDYPFPDARTVFGELAAAVRDVTKGMSNAERVRLMGIGLAAPGGIGDPRSLQGPSAEQTALWQKIDIAQAAAEATGLELRIYNDGNAACFAEYVAHPVPKPQSMAYLLIATFVGAGIVAENRLWEGATHGSANLGSMMVAARSGGLTTVHEVASLFALDRRLAGAGLTLEDVLDARATPIINEWIEDSAYVLAQTILNTATVIEYEEAVIEGVLPPAIMARLLDAVRRDMGSASPSLGRDVPPLVAGHLGRSGAAQGAGQRFLFQKLLSRQLEDAEG